VTKPKKVKQRTKRHDKSSVEDWKQKAVLLKIMAHPLRLSILETLSDGSRCVKDLNALMPVPQPQLSRQMAVLREAELVACHSDGPLRCYYVLRPELVRNLIKMLKKDHPPVYRSRQAVQKEARKE